jgi:outer membrane immunogenic protein
LNEKEPASTKDTPYVVVAGDWTGMYAGVTVGGGWGTSKNYVSPNGNDAHGWAENDPDGVVIGGTLGYNYQFSGTDWLIGAETDLSWMDLQGEQGKRIYDGHYWTGGWDGLFTLRARLGYVMGRTLIYGTAGYAALHTNETISGNDTDESNYGTGWRSGYVVGAGVEHKFTDRVSGKVEYLHAGFDDQTGPTGFPGNSANQSYIMRSDADILRVGLNYKFY